MSIQRQLCCSTWNDEDQIIILLNFMRIVPSCLHIKTCSVSVFFCRSSRANNKHAFLLWTEVFMAIRNNLCAMMYSCFQINIAISVRFPFSNWCSRRFTDESEKGGSNDGILRSADGMQMRYAQTHIATSEIAAHSNIWSGRLCTMFHHLVQSTDDNSALFLKMKNEDRND